jgi:hypothetical protein
MEGSNVTLAVRLVQGADKCDLSLAVSPSTLLSEVRSRLAKEAGLTDADRIALSLEGRALTALDQTLQQACGARSFFVVCLDALVVEDPAGAAGFCTAAAPHTTTLAVSLPMVIASFDYVRAPSTRSSCVPSRTSPP